MRAMQSATFVMGWFVTGKADGRVTVEEMTNLIRGLAGIWKIRIDLDIGPSPIAPTQNLERRPFRFTHIRRA